MLRPCSPNFQNAFVSVSVSQHSPVEPRAPVFLNWTCSFLLPMPAFSRFDESQIASKRPTDRPDGVDLLVWQTFMGLWLGSWSVVVLAAAVPYAED